MASNTASRANIDRSNLIERFLYNFFELFKLSKTASSYLVKISIIILIILAAYIINIIARYTFLKIAEHIIFKTRNKWDDVIWHKGVVKRISRIIPALVIYFTVIFSFDDNSGFSIITRRLSMAYIIGVGVFVFLSVIDALEDIYKSFEISKKKPIKGYLQLVKIFAYFLGAIFILTALLNKSPWGIISGVGAMTAVLLLIFKDSILGFVASVRLNSTQAVLLGDWITVPSKKIDGDVIDISLYTITVRNFDKTLSYISSYELISGVFQNWRGMEEAGARRIKRSLYIDVSSIKFLSDDQLSRLKEVRLVSEAINVEELTSNTDFATNIGIFRKYVFNYLKNHSMIRNDFTLLVRQLEPCEFGVPVEVYAFAGTTLWDEYEEVQAEIIEHIISVSQFFGLKIFQYPTGYDITSAMSVSKKGKVIE